MKPPNLTSTDALFLDFDGTLVDIAARPEQVVVTSALRELLASLQQALAGAVGIISGRPIGDLDRLLQPLRFVAAGEHGAEIRYWQDGQIRRESTLPEDTARAIQELASRLQGTQAELKQASASLHYRQAPQHESAVVDGMRSLEQQLDGYALILGKMVAELKPERVDKGIAIRDLCSREPFAGRRPVFIGDDVTDEAGFATVNSLDGVSIRVGELTGSNANYSIADATELRDWLTRMVKDSK